MNHENCTKFGPSPREWGEPAAAGRDGAGRRTIPTRVGRTGRAGAINVVPADHPHASGENPYDDVTDGSVFGPSPREWGEQAQRARRQKDERTIPTRVGRTGTPSPNRLEVADHPHASGENDSHTDNRLRDVGPSPREWGEHHGPCMGRQSDRTIPTRVGRTLSGSRPAEMGADHPHASGENKEFSARQCPIGGPSPREWGELGSKRAAGRLLRTIPTRVGRTVHNRFMCVENPDHPHASGENHSTRERMNSSTGPSPREWGEL